MTDIHHSDSAGAGLRKPNRLVGLIAWFNRLCASIPKALPLLVMRLAGAFAFLFSGLLKWEGFLKLNDSAVFLFANEYKLHIFGGEYSMPAPQVLAYLAGLGEVCLPILLIVGFASRFSALGLLVMTGVIQLVYPGAWHSAHLPYAAALFGIVVMGPGWISLDGLIARFTGLNASRD